MSSRNCAASCAKCIERDIPAGNGLVCWQEGADAHLVEELVKAKQAVFPVRKCQRPLTTGANEHLHGLWLSAPLSLAIGSIGSHRRLASNLSGASNKSATGVPVKISIDA